MMFKNLESKKQILNEKIITFHHDDDAIMHGNCEVFIKWIQQALAWNHYEIMKPKKYYLTLLTHNSKFNIKKKNNSYILLFYIELKLKKKYIVSWGSSGGAEIVVAYNCMQACSQRQSGSNL